MSGVSLLAITPTAISTGRFGSHALGPAAAAALHLRLFEYPIELYLVFGAASLFLLAVVSGLTEADARPRVRLGLGVALLLVVVALVR